MPPDRTGQYRSLAKLKHDIVMKTIFLYTSIFLILLVSCGKKQHPKIEMEATSPYLDYSNSDDQFTGGITMIPITTPKGTFKVWTKRVGNNPKMKVLLLHGGPGGTHEFFECFDGYLPKEEIEYIYYDQLDSYYSEKPNDSTLWTTEHFVEEVEYALKYQDNLKGLIISNMMASIPEYEKYAAEVLGPQLPPEVYKEIKDMEANNDFMNPKYTELVTQHYYTEHFLRLPLDKWPESINRAMAHLNPNIYVFMQGYSEFGVTGDPKYMEWMSKELPKGKFLLCPNGSHLSQYDDQKTYFNGLIKFIKDVDQKTY